MAKYKLTKPCFFGEQLHKAGDIVDFGEQPAPQGSIEIAPTIVEKAKAKVAAAAATPEAAAAAEDALLKGAAQK